MPAILAAWVAELCDITHHQMSSQSSILYSIHQLLPWHHTGTVTFDVNGTARQPIALGCRPWEAPIYGCLRFWGFEGPKSAQSLSEFWGFEGPELENLPEACLFLGI